MQSENIIQTIDRIEFREQYENVVDTRKRRTVVVVSQVVLVA